MIRGFGRWWRWRRDMRELAAWSRAVAVDLETVRARVAPYDWERFGDL